MSESESRFRSKSPNPTIHIESTNKVDSKDHIRTLIRKRAGFRSRLTLFKTFLQKYQESDVKFISKLEIKEISLRLSQIQEMMTNFDNIQMEIEELCNNFDEQLSERNETESEFYKQIALAQELIELFSDNIKNGSDCNSSVKSSCCHGHGTNSVKLPTINLPIFDGNYSKWLEFRDTFKSLIHDDSSIAPINKYHYLRNSLQSSASVVIRSLGFSADNYEIAWQTLCDRYNNKNILINNHLHALTSINHINRESYRSLRYISDQVFKNLNALNTLEVPTKGWDPLVIYLISAKLDPKTRGKWEEYKGRMSQLPTLDDFRNFLENRANVLESASSNSNVENKNNNNLIKNTKSFALVSKKSFHKNCPVCSENHLVYQCSKFKSMNINDRITEVTKHKLCRNCLRSGHNNLECKLRGSCRICKDKHNTYLHNQVDTDEPNIPISLSAVSSGQVLLCTAQVKIINNKNNCTYLARALLDTGSQSSFITKNLKEKIGIQTEKINPVNVCGINNLSCVLTERCQIKIKSRVNNFYKTIDCYVIPKVTNQLPATEINVSQLGLPNNLELADPGFYKPSDIDILIGADYLFDFIISEKINLGKNKPVLQHSVLGWLLAGPTGQNQSSSNVLCSTLVNNESTLPIQKRFWEVEGLPSDTCLQDENFCESHFVKTTRRLPNGRFSVSMPLKADPEQTLGDSFNIAKRRFLSLEHKLHKNLDLKVQYRNFINEYVKLGHATEIRKPLFGCYLPHHCVIREQHETTKLRVVFDASSKTSSGKSLNDIQAVGPVVQSDLFSILIRFRIFKYVLTGDVKMMYRQIVIDQSQRHLQLVLWRDNIDQPIKILQLNTVTYGTSSAPFLATRCLLELSKECQDELVSNVIRNHFYVDDLNTGSFSKEMLQHIYLNTKRVLEAAGFPLRKFRTNCPQLLTDSTNTSNSLDFSSEATVLGLKWSPLSDNLYFPSNIDTNDKVTKRIIISTTCKLFDPLGLVSCCIIKAKILLQNLWVAKLDWDEPVPKQFAKKWLNFKDNLHHISNITLKRHVLCNISDGNNVELHCFVDASQEAYGACIYLRSSGDSLTFFVKLLCAKTRVAPIKGHTIPRLELCAALLGAQLCNKVMLSVPCTINKKHIWTDSTVVLSWLKSQSKTLPTFVRNRVNKINEITQHYIWNHVPTNLNPADLASRGVEPQNLSTLTLWWAGPSFLSNDPSSWPTQPLCLLDNKVQSNTLLSVNIRNFNYDENEFIKFENYSNYLRLIRTYAYVLRFISNCKKSNIKIVGSLDSDELNKSLNILTKFSQSQSFTHEINNLSCGKPLEHKSRILSLNPFLDEEGILRVGGRISHSDFHYDKKHPIVLDAKHHFTKLLMKHEHLRLFHAGPQLLLSSVRERFWPLGGRHLARAIAKQCIVCTRLRGKTIQPIMGDLPSARVNCDFPFNSCGIDFAGPFMISSKKGRGNRITKAYLCVFVCLATKAIHLEVVSDLSTESFILCLRRFISRRGKPHTIYCDNGKNFVGTSNQLGRVIRSSRQSVSDYSANEGIKFMFCPAYSPHFGGIWEAGVKSAKFHLKRIAGNASLTFEELATLFAQIEAILNSRPLSPLSSNPNDLLPLTPGHFLIGRPLTSMPSLSVLNARPNRYQYIERIRQQFWERWRREFIAELQQRTKWKRDSSVHLQVGDLVILKEDNLGPLQWRMGRITKLFPGHDGVCRVADIYTTKGLVRRALNKICPLQ